MRNKLVLTMALACFAVVTALGVGMAGADPSALTTTEAPPVTVAGATLPSPEPPACSNGLDDDADGLVDLEDPDCKEDPNGTSEAPPAEAGPAAAEAPASATPAPAEGQGGLQTGQTI
ncbi:MAG TPA: hypothetical protein VG518_08860, partial [Solirubrobacterales bacterium]|nr:hypothetical protein [Solirubrobacterales bacterium]